MIRISSDTAARCAAQRGGLLDVEALGDERRPEPHRLCLADLADQLSGRFGCSSECVETEFGMRSHVHDRTPPRRRALASVRAVAESPTMMIVMSFRLANVAGRAALVLGDRSVDIESTTDGRLGSEAGQLLSAAPVRTYPSCIVRSPLRYRRARSTRRSSGPPIPNPAQVFGVGLNYANHAFRRRDGRPRSAADLHQVPVEHRPAPNAEIQLRSDLLRL